MKNSRLLFLSLLTLWTRVVFADANTTISAAEYFVDTDPGEGNGTALSAQDGAFDSEVESIAPVDLNVTGLAVGPHLIGIRYKDDNNTWGEVLYQTIHVYDANPDSNASGGGGNGGGGGSSAGFATIKGAEYFVDSDPGEGNGTAFQAQDGAFDSEVESILPKDLNVTGLAVGPHLVGLRYQDNNNTWGEVLYQTIHVYDANPDSNASGGGGSGGGGGSSGGFATIQAAEYFVDTDPGEGNGTAFQAQDGAFDSEVESILPKDLNVTGLSIGPHLVGVRYKDNNNTWGEVLYQTIHVYDANPDTNASGSGGSGGSGGTGGFTVIAGAEYFIGNDPGEGNATALHPKDGAFDSEVESTLTASLSLEGYAIGAYLVGVRYMDNNGTWGDVLYKTIEVDVDTDGDGLADKAEIYYETNSTVQDTDGDGYLDGEEVAFGSNPKDANSLGNRAPTDLNATTVLSILENLPSGEFVAEFNATDGESNSTFTYSLADGNGSGGNMFFSIDANGTLRTASVLDYESNASHSIRVRVSDQHNYFLDKVFTVQVQDMDEGTAPTLGDGSEENPYQIDTLAHLKWLSFYDSEWEDKFFIQTSDINATETKTWANGYGFRPIGPHSGAFKGNYDGQGFQIRNLFIYRPSESRSAGLFSRVLHSDLKNIRILDANITGNHYAGGIAGNSNNVTIENSSFEGAIKGAQVGGLIGRNESSQIIGSFSHGSVYSNEVWAGGIAGYSEESKIINCYSHANIDGGSPGGLVGRNTGNSLILYSYSKGEVGAGMKGGGLVNVNGGTITNSFWDINSSGRSNNPGSGAVGKSTAEMMDPSTFLNAGWDFNQTGGTWKMIAGQTYPHLAWETLPNTPPSDLDVTAPLQVLENQPAGTLVGQFTAYDPDIPSSLSYRIDNAYVDKYSLRLDANGTLWTKAPLDYEANETLTIRVKVQDQHDAWIKQNFTVQILNVVEDLDGDGIEDAYDTDDDGDGYSDAEEIAYGSDPRDANSVADTLPTGLTLSSLEIMENKPVGTIVGQFTVIDPDINDSHIIKFNDINENISHNHLFTIDANNTLRTAVVFDYENNSSTLYLRVKAKQNKVGVFWKFFTLSLVNDTVDDLSPPSENNQTSTPIIDHNITGDHNATQPPVIDQNGTISQTDQNNTRVDQNSTQLRKEYLAIVRTLDSRNEQNGTSRLYGKILTDGGSIISEKGFLVSTNLQFLNSERISGIDHNQTDPFFADYQTTQNGQTFYYRAYVRNNVGESLGGIKKISPSTPRSWWNELPEIAGGWRTSPWFGSFRPYPNGWLYHADLGWLYSHTGKSRDLWLWNEQLGWHWTAQGVYPHLFLHSSANWLYFITKKDGKPYFYDYDTGKLK